MKIEGIKDSIAYKEAIGFSKVFEAYAEEVGSEYIMEIGFNANSGIVYIALENGISICSSIGGDVEFLTMDYDDNEETFFDSYEEALEFIDRRP